MTGIRARARGVGFGVGAAFIALAALGPVTASGAAGTPRCASSQLELREVLFQGATGKRVWDFAFSNTGSKCTLRGYPGAGLLDKHGHLLATAKRVPTTVKTITIANNRRAFFRFVYEDGGFCPGSNYNAYRFQFIAPNLTHKFIFNPTALNHGVVSVCKRSEQINPVTATAGG
jgi:Protein of unknown function (DUF4232)